VITLRRLTSSLPYLPFIDGLRFFAILPVILVHFVDFYESHTVTIESQWRVNYLDGVIGNSDNAVLLFFAISGFVLGLPFANHFFKKETLPKLKLFYTRRLTRLEPPYLIVLTVLMLMNVFLFHKSALTEQLPHYFASFFYLHNIIYQSYPEINFVFWSLEIEVQFYLLAPLLAKVFQLETIKRRTSLLGSMIIFGTLNHYFKTPFISLFNYLHYFLAGFLALDLYLTTTSKKRYLFDFFAILLLLSFWTGSVKYGVLLPFVLGGFIFCVSKSTLIFKFTSLKWISIVGGMCYSLYMLHYPVMAAFLNRVTGHSFLTSNSAGDFFIKLGLCLVVIFVVSAVFFILIERPCMKKEWYKTIFRRKLTES